MNSAPVSSCAFSASSAVKKSHPLNCKCQRCENWRITAPLRAAQVGPRAASMADRAAPLSPSSACPAVAAKVPTPRRNPGNFLSLELVVGVISRLTGIPIEAMRQRDRAQKVGTARNLAYDACYEFTPATWKDIADFFHRGDHATTYFGARTARRICEVSESSRLQRDRIWAELRAIASPNTRCPHCGAPRQSETAAGQPMPAK